MPHLPSIRRSIQRNAPAGRASQFEKLEGRQLLSSASISYSDFSSIVGLAATGFGSTSAASGGDLIMTDSQQNEARSVFYDTPVPFGHFTTHFSYRADAGAQADGFTFALQENGATALGAIGGSLGYQNMGGEGVAVGVSIFNRQFRIYSGNNTVYTSSPFSGTPFIDVGNGDTYDFTISYDGTTLTTSIVDESNSASTYTNSFALDLNAALNASTAYVGFTAATGALISTQRILDWDYSGNDGFTITTPAAASPGVVTGTTTALSVAATDMTNGGILNYNWTLLHKPSGAANPTFGTNDGVTANDTTANFFKDGTYVFQVTASNANGLFDVSDVNVTVQQTATAVRVAQHAQTIKKKSQKRFTAMVTDQFGHPMRTQPTLGWRILRGSGAIDPTTGLFTPGSDRGHVVIQANDMLDSLTGVVGATVV
jgi:hypothetical protein